jgi:hypothetical protein
MYGLIISSRTSFVFRSIAAWNLKRERSQMIDVLTINDEDKALPAPLVSVALKIRNVFLNEIQ